MLSDLTWGIMFLIIFFLSLQGSFSHQLSYSLNFHFIYSLLWFLFFYLQETIILSFPKRNSFPDFSDFVTSLDYLLSSFFLNCETSYKSNNSVVITCPFLSLGSSSSDFQSAFCRNALSEVTVTNLLSKLPIHRFISFPPVWSFWFRLPFPLF